MDEDTGGNDPRGINMEDTGRLRPEHIRKWPGVVIGGTNSAALHGLADELISFSIEEVLAGFARSIHARINAEGSLTVADDGRGIPAEIHPRSQLSILELVMTVNGTNTPGDWFPRGERITGAVRSLHGIGARAITALSDWAEAVVCWNGRIYRQRYERGQSASDVCDIGVSGAQAGTKITFHPDPEIFHAVTFEWDRLEARLRELAFLNKGLLLTLRDDRSRKTERFKYDGGVADSVRYLNRSEQALHEPIYADRIVKGVKVEVALQFTTGTEEYVRGYANSAYNSVGGTHLNGFRRALTRTLSRWAREAKLFKKSLQPIGVDFRNGLTALISVHLSEPMFESQNKLRLCNPEVEGIVVEVVSGALAAFLKANATDAESIIKKAIKARDFRIAGA